MNQRLLGSAVVLSLCYACGSSGSGGGASAGASSTSAGAGNGTAGGSLVGSAGAGTAGAAMGTVGDNQNVTQRGGDNARTAHWVQSTFTTENVAKMALDTSFKATFKGNMSAVPLFVAGATPSTGFYIVATQDNKVYALDETTGESKWAAGATDLGAPQAGHNGEMSTPVIDATTRTVYIAAGMATNRYELHALNLDTGVEKPNWPAVISTIKSGNISMDFGVTEQRSALSLVGGIVYTAFGGYIGDNGDYHGWVVGVNAADPTKTGAWATMDDQQAGIWAAGGMASDGNGVFAITGNVDGAKDHATSDSEEIIRITALGTPHRDDTNMFYPDIWYTGMNNGDKDFGACSPSVITVPNSTPSKLIIAPAKPGIVYVLDAAKLGGENGALSSTVVAQTDAESLYAAPTAYQVGATGVSVAISTGVGSKCPKDQTLGGAIMGLTVQPGNGTMKPALISKWCAAISTDTNVTRRSPVSTNSNATGADPIVWFMNGSALNAYNGDTGAVVYPPQGVMPAICDGVQKFTAPIVADGHVVVGGNGHLCSFSVH